MGIKMHSRKSVQKSSRVSERESEIVNKERLALVSRQAYMFDPDSGRLTRRPFIVSVANLANGTDLFTLDFAGALYHMTLTRSSGKFN
jgi:hypothetical protein